MKYALPLLLIWCTLPFSFSRSQTCDITVSPGLSFCGNSQVSFSATTSLDSSATFSWTFGDGNGANGNPVQHNYGYNNGDQTYTVTLTATDTSGNSCTITETVTALYHPQIIFGGPTQLCLNDSTCNDTLVQSFNLSTTAPGPFIWNWNNGDPPDTTAGPSISHTFIGYGNDPVTVTALGSQCPSVVQAINFFNEPTRPILDLPPDDLCAGDTAEITIIHNPCPNNISYYVVFWDYPNAGPGQVDTFFSPGTYTHLYDLPCNANIATQNRSIHLFPVNPCYPADPNFNTSWVGTGITIKTAPVPDFGANPNPGCWPDDSVVLFTNTSCPNIFNDPLSFTWTFGDPGSGANDTSTFQFPSHIYPGPGTYPVTLTASNNACGARSITQNVVIDEIPEAAFTSAGPSNCVPATFTFTNGSTPTGANYLWEIINAGSGFQFSGGTDANSQNPEITFTQAGTYIVQLTTSNPPCGQAVFLDTIVVFDVPIVSLVPQPDSCDVVTYQMSGAVVDNGCAISSYFWDFGPNASPTTANTLIPPPVTFFAGTHTVSFSATNCCGTATQTTDFIIYDAAQVSGGQDTSLCIDSNQICLQASPSGGTWTLNGVVDSVGCFTFPLAGIYEIIYGYDTLGCSFVDTVIIEVNDLPAVDAGGPLDVCAGDTLLLNGASPIGGSWSGFGLVSANEFSTDSVGTFVLFYSFQDGTSTCENVDSLSIAVTPLPTVDAGPPISFCETNQDLPLPPATVSPIGGNGNWSGPGITDPVNGLFNPVLAGGVGSYVLVYTYSDPNGCTHADSLVVVVDPLPQITFSTPDTILCQNDAPITLLAIPNGGFWIGGAGFVAPGTFDPTGLPGGFYPHTYTLNAGNSCEVAAILDIEVRDTTVVEAGANVEICEDQAPFLLTGFSPAGGIWSGTGVDPSGLVDPAQIPAGSAVQFTYTVADSIADCISQDVLTVTNHPLPVVEAGLATTFCQTTDTLQLPVPTPGGGVWSGPGVVNAQNGWFLPPGTGVFTITYCFTDLNSCESCDTVDITVVPPVVAEAGPDTVVCVDVAPFIIQGFTPAGLGTWSGPGVNPSTGEFDPAAAGPGTHILDYCVGVASCFNCDQITITVDPLPVVDAGPALEACVGDAAFLLPAGSPATSGQWIWSGPSVSQTGLDSYFFDPATVGTFTLTYTYTDPTTNCVNTDQTDVVVHPLPMVEAGIATTFCQTTDTLQLPVPTPVGGIWSGPGVVDGQNGWFLPPGTGVFTITYCFTDLNSCESCDTVDITVVPPVVAEAGPDTVVCVDMAPFIIQGFTPVGLGTWSGPGVNPSTGEFDPAAAGPGTHILNYCVGVASCFNCDQITITVDPLPVVDAGPALEACVGDAAFLLPAGSPATSGQWIWSGPSVSQTGLDSYFFDPATVGTFTLTYTYTDPTTNCVNTDQTDVVVHPLPVVEAGIDTTYCLTPDTQQLPLATPQPGNWSGPGVVDPQNGLFLPTAVALATPFTVTIYFQHTDGNLCTNLDSVLVTVIEPDSISAGADTIVCENQGPFLLQGFYPVIGGSWSGPGIVNASTGLFDPALAGPSPTPHLLIYSTGSGSCTIVDSLEVLVQPIPSISATLDSMCISDPAIALLNGLAFGAPPSAPNTWAWIGDGVDTLSPTAYQFDPALLPPGTNPIGFHPVIFSYTDSVNTIGCTAFDTTFIRVDSLPGANFLLPGNFCIGDTICLTNTSTDASSYVWDFGSTTATPPSSSLVNPCVVYSDTGSFTITLIATAPTGCSDTISLPIFLSEPPQPTFISNVDTACAQAGLIPGSTGLGSNGIEVQLTDLSNAAGGSYFWDFGGGALLNGDGTSTDENPGVVYFAQDDSVTVSYGISLTIVNFCDSVTFTDSITVKPLPRAIFAPDFSTFCSPYVPQWVNPSIGEPDSFYWYVDDFSNLVSTDSVPTNIVLTYDPVDSLFTLYTVYLVAVNECGRDTASHDITVLPNTITAFFNVDTTSGCAPLTVTVISYANGPNISFDMGDGTTYGLDTVVHTYTTPGTYQLQHFADNNCSYDTNAVTITVFDFPDISFVPDDTTICPFEPLTFVDTTGTINSTNYLWDFGDGGPLSSAISPTHSWEQPGTYPVIVSVTSTLNGCPASDTGQVVVLPNPEVSFTTPDTAGCLPLVAQFTNTSGASATSFLWEFGHNGNTSGVTNPTYSYTDPGTYFAILNGFDAQGCYAADTQRIVVFPLPTASFSFVQSDSCGASPTDPVSVSFTNLSTDTLVSYLWSFGDGTTSTDVNPSHDYSQPDTFEVQLIVTSVFEGCADTSIQEIIIYPQPQAILLVNDDAGCEELLVNITNASTDVTGAWFDFGDGNDSSTLATSLTYAYSAPTGDITYSLHLEVNYAGVCFDGASLPITVFSRPSAAFVQDQDSSCGAPVPYSFTNQSSDFDLITSYEWSFGDGNGSQATDPVHTYGATGSYPISLVVTNDNGCRDTAESQATLIPQPVAEIFADRTIGCLQDMQVQFASVQPDSATSWLWEFGDGNLDFGPQVSHQYLQPDTVFAVLSLNHSGFCFDQDSIRLEIGHDVVSAFELLPMGECSDAVEVFTVNNSQFADRYLWAFGDGRNSEAFNPIVPFDWPGEYRFELIAYNDYFQCSDTSEQLLEYPRSSAGFDFDAVSGCSPFTVQFQDTSRGVTEWIWDFGDGSPVLVTTENDSVAHTYREGGTYQVTLYVNYQGVCQDTFVSNKLVRVIQSPEAGFEVIPQPEPPGFLQFLDTSRVPGDFYEWDFGDGSPGSSEQSPFHQYEILDSVRVIQYVSNVAGCRDSAQKTILSGAYGLFVPSAFVPGGPSGEAWTFFKPVGVGLAEYEIAVYNKYGNKLFGSTLLDADGRPDEAWDGTARGIPVQAGTYIWRIHTARFKNGAELQGRKEGSVTIIR